MSHQLCTLQNKSPPSYTTTQITSFVHYSMNHQLHVLHKSPASYITKQITSFVHHSMNHQLCTSQHESPALYMTTWITSFVYHNMKPRFVHYSMNHLLHTTWITSLIHYKTNHLLRTPQHEFKLCTLSVNCGYWSGTPDQRVKCVN